MFNKNPILKYLGTEKTSTMIAICTISITSGATILTPFGINYLIQNAIEKNNLDLMVKIYYFAAIFFLIFGFVSWFQIVLIGRASQRITKKIKTNILNHIQKLDSIFFNQNTSGDLISRITGDTQKVSDFFGQNIFQFTSSFFSFLALGIYLFILNPNLALLSYLAILSTVIINLILSKSVRASSLAALNDSGKMKGFISDNFNNYQIIQAFGLKNNLMDQFKTHNEFLQESTEKNRIYTTIFRALYNFSSNLGLSLILFGSVFQFKIFNQVNGILQISVLITFVYGANKFFEPLRILGSVFSNLQEALAALSRIETIISTPIQSNFSPKEDAVVEIDQSQNAIEFENVNFSYDLKMSKMVCKNMNFIVPAKSKLAIIGPTGQGKSTIAKLISGLLAPNSGIIKIFDLPISSFNQNQFFETIGFILQDPYLFSGTVAANICYGNKQFEEDMIKLELLKSNKLLDKSVEKEEKEMVKTLVTKLIAEMKNQNLFDLIPDLENFLPVIVDNNSQNISLGQKQLINFIRAILRKPKILILDEATANLDTITEKKLQSILQTLNSQITQVVIAHREITIQDADQVLLVGNGNLTKIR